MLPQPGLFSSPASTTTSTASPTTARPSPETNVTHASLLRQAGYATGYFGKWHQGGQKGQRPGFDTSASFIGQGKYFDCPFEINGQLTPTTGWVDDITTNYAIDFIKNNKTKPFLAVVGFKSCHVPVQPPERTKDLYANDDARPADNARPIAIYHKGETPATVPTKQSVPHDPAKVRDTFRTLKAVDDNVGRLLATLDEQGLTENTVVIFTSDNGYYLGEHGLGDKRSAYEESMRIPLLIRYPKLGLKGETRDQMVLNIDLAPTLLSFAGVPIPASMQGQSWRILLQPVQQKELLRWRTAFFYEYFFETNFPRTPTTLAVRTETAKLIKYPGHEDWTELFDLTTDPGETQNLAPRTRPQSAPRQTGTRIHPPIRVRPFPHPTLRRRPQQTRHPPAWQRSRGGIAPESV